MGVAADDRRITKLASARLEPGEEIMAWSRAWVSRPGRLGRAAAARFRHFVVVTDRRMLLWSTRFWTRRPRRRVLAERLDALRLSPAGGPTRLTVGRPGERALLVEMRDHERGRAVAAALRAGIAAAEASGTEAAGSAGTEPDASGAGE